MTASHILAIDQGTTSTRAIVFDGSARPVATAHRELPQIFPKPGWVEHDAEEIWSATVAVCREVLAKAGLQAAAIAGIGITNQRETVVVWERASGRPIHNALVWQDRRTSEHCARLKADGVEPMLSERTGLLADPYFSATKLAWILDAVPGARTRARNGDLAFGTIESFLLWRLTAGRSHLSDATNAARTLLFDIRAQRWDPDLLRLFDVPEAMLPGVVDNAGNFGVTPADLLGAPIPVLGMAGDQQAATIGQACLAPGMIKSTYGTGCFALLNTGDEALRSKNRLLTTIAYRLDGRPTYALEGSIFVAGAAVQWLRDGLKVIGVSAEIEALAARAAPGHGVYLVPAFVGLGAPYWDPDARGAILGLTRDSGAAEIAQATLDSVCYQTRDLIEAMRADGAVVDSIRVDGGMTVNDHLMQRLADSLGLAVERPTVTETTALGAAFLAGLQAGLFPGLDAIAKVWVRDKAYAPQEPAQRRDHRYAGWQDAVRRVRSHRA
jgi:glycerol kinase